MSFGLVRSGLLANDVSALDIKILESIGTYSSFSARWLSYRNSSLSLNFNLSILKRFDDLLNLKV